MRKLKRGLGLFDLFAMGTGAMLSSGLFILPGIIYKTEGPSISLSYLIALVIIIPAMLSKSELATAMPRAGGPYYFIDRSLGPIFGTIAGVGTWLSVLLKNTFLLIGIGYYLQFILKLDLLNPFLQNFEWDGIYIKIIGSIIIIFSTVINLFKERENRTIQITGFIILFIVLLFLTIRGMLSDSFHIDNFTPFFTGKNGAMDIFYASGLVVVPYIIGFSKMTALGEEVKNPERNIPLGMILSAVIVTILYIFGVLVLIGDLGSGLSGNYHPIGNLASVFLPNWAVLLVIFGIFFAFLFAFQSGSHSASRYPVAMSRDKLIPEIFSRIDHKDIPVPSVVVTSLTMVLMLWIIPNIAFVAKLASTFQLLIFGFMNFAVIVMRMSKIHSYDPGFKSPLFPLFQLFGIFSSIGLIIILGINSKSIVFNSITFALGLVVIGLIWYLVYVKRKGEVERYGAIRKVFDKLYNREASVLGIETEFREILKEKGVRDHDDFNSILERCFILDIKDEITPTQLFEMASEKLSERFRSITKDDILKELLEANETGMTPVAEGIAIPHAKFENVSSFELLMARVQKGISFDNPGSPVTCIFIIIGSKNDPKKHLRILAEIAVRADRENFLNNWRDASNEQELWKVMKIEAQRD